MYIHKYRIFCQTEEKFVYKWDDKIPNVCPNNDSHMINDNIVIVDTLRSNSVEIIEEKDNSGDKTMGRFRSNGIYFDINNDEEVICFSWVYPIAALNIKISPVLENIGDNIECKIFPASFLCYCEESKLSGTDNIRVDSVNLENVLIGKYVNIFLDDNKIYFLGKIINKIDDTIYFDNVIPHDVKKNSYIVEYLPIGYLTNNTNIDDINIDISPGSVSYLSNGLNLEVIINDNFINLGEIHEINNNRIRMEKNIENVYPVGTLIFPSSSVIKKFNFTSTNRYIIGDSKIGGSYIKKFYIIKVIYKRQGIDNKKLYCDIEYLY